MAASLSTSNALYAGFRRGIVSLPGATHASKETARQLLTKDVAEHHCYFRSAGLHNHLSHHMLAAYDLGASAGLLKKKYEAEASYQRPIFVEEKDKNITVTDENWTQYLGNQSAYGGFVKFFEDKVQANGVTKALESYVFASEANNNNVSMLVRLVSGALHPFIQIGYGLEFGLDALVATGLAQAAIHNPTLAPKYYPFSFSETSAPAASSTSLWTIFRELYDSKTLAPVMPYKPDAFLSERTKDFMQDGRPEELHRLTASLAFPNGAADVARYTDEITWLAALQLFATSKPGRAVRLDFFLMHLVTSSIFLPSYLKALEGSKSEYKEDLIRAYVPTMMMYNVVRGRPKIDIHLVMSYTDVPRPPNTSLAASDKSTSGSPHEDEEYNPWPAMFESVLYAPDSHTLKTMRALVYAAQRFGETPKGGVLDSTGAQLEAKSGLRGLDDVDKLDGTLFVRCAGVLMEYMGWTEHGQAARADWDRSALGWDDAWKDTDA